MEKSKGQIKYNPVGHKDFVLNTVVNQWCLNKQDYFGCQVEK